METSEIITHCVRIGLYGTGGSADVNSSKLAIIVSKNALHTRVFYQNSYKFMVLDVGDGAKYITIELPKDVEIFQMIRNGLYTNKVSFEGRIDDVFMGIDVSMKDRIINVLEKLKHLCKPSQIPLNVDWLSNFQSVEETKPKMKPNDTSVHRYLRNGLQVPVLEEIIYDANKVVIQKGKKPNELTEKLNKPPVTPKYADYLIPTVKASPIPLKISIQHHQQLTCSY